MATFFYDPVNGNDANDGTTFANRWKTLTSGATAARVAPGDLIKCIASPDPTSLGVNCTWTNASRSLLLASALTMNISDCETVWTPATNVTASSSTSTYREGTKASQLVVASAFTTGLIGYVATGALNLSAYQQVSFQFRCTLALAAGTLQLKLCSDTAGVTAVHTINIPANGASVWMPVVFDNAAALSTSIQSVALYAVTDPGSATIYLDNIIACKASSGNDGLTHNSLIGKVHNLSWVAGTAYALGDTRRPTQANRNGFQYKVTTAGTSNATTEPAWPEELGVTVSDGTVVWTCDSPEETWWALASINGTTVTVEGNPSDPAPTTTRGYSGTTETVLTYKREPIYPTVITSGTTSNNVLQDSGTAGAFITLSGGWDRTAMTTQSGESWINGQTGFGAGFNATTKNYWAFQNLHYIRFSQGWSLSSCTNIEFSASHTNHNLTGCVISNTRIQFKGCTFMGNSSVMSGGSSGNFNAKQLNVIGNVGSAGLQWGPGYSDVNYLWFRNNASGVTLQTGGTNSGAFAVIKNLRTDNNAATNIFPSQGGGFDLVSPVFAEATPIADPIAANGCWVSVTRYNDTDNDHRRITDGGTIVSATDQRHTASGISWKFMPTSTSRGESYPLRMAVAQIACVANTAKTVTIWTRRDNTNIKGRLILRGGQLPGCGQDKYVDCQPTINTWVQSASLIFTPTHDGVIEIEFHAWDGVGTTNSFWIDDLAVS